MSKKYLTPAGAPTPKNYHHVVVSAPGSMIFISGQLAFDAQRNIVGAGDVIEQTRQAMRNLQAAVTAGGGQMSDVVQITTYVVDYTPDQLEGITNTIAEFFDSSCLPTNTLLGVASLSTVGLLVEISGIAVVGDHTSV